MADRRARGLLLLGLCYLGFVSLGLPDGLLGVAWPSIRRSFALPLDALGPLLLATTTGYVASSSASGWILRRTHVGALLTLSCATTAASLALYATAPAWGFLLAGGLLAGLGAGAIDAGLNTHVASQHGPRTLNWLHACYGVGAASGPLLMASVLMAGHPWRRGYALVGAGQLALALGFLASGALWPRAATRAAAPLPPAAPGASALRLPIAWLGIAAFFVYTGLEAAAGAWAYSFLTEARGVAPMRAGSWVSAYWAALMAGRLVFGLLVRPAALPQLLRGCLALLAVGAGLLSLAVAPALAFGGLALFGFAAGPVFPSLIAATPARVGEGHAASAIGFQIAAAALGQSLLPGLVGALGERLGLGVLGPLLLGGALLLAVLHEALLRASAGRTAPARRPGPLAPAVSDHAG